MLQLSGKSNHTGAVSYSYHAIMLSIQDLANYLNARLLHWYTWQTNTGIQCNSTNFTIILSPLVQTISHTVADHGLT